MFAGVRTRLALTYALTFSAALLLLGPVLYLSFSSEMAAATDVALRLAARREAALAFISSGTTLGINRRFRAPPFLAQKDTFYLLLTPSGRLRANPVHVYDASLPDVTAAREAAQLKVGELTTLSTRDVGDIRLYTVPILRHGRVVALLQAGYPLTSLDQARRNLLVELLALGAGAVAAATIGGLLLAKQAMRPINAAFASQRAFVADASHELRTPLTLIRTNAEVLLESHAFPDPDERALVDDIVAEAERMGRLVTDLLTLARLDAGVLPLTRLPVDLDDVVRTCCHRMARLAERRAITIDAHDVRPLSVPGDEGRLSQMVLVLLDNAVKYNTAGGTVTLSVRREGQQAVLEVRDSGIGIPADDLPHLFARFHRGRRGAATTDGNGLGLAIAHGIARAHGGQIRAWSEPGKGSRFRVSLPLPSRVEVGRAMVGARKS